MQTSLCTGGILSLVTYGIAQTVVTYDDSAPMSYAAMEYLSCKHTQHDSQLTADAAPGCDNADTCLQQAFSASRERALGVVAQVVDAVIVNTQQLQVDATAPPELHNRSKPLHYQAQYLAYTTVQRE